MAAVLTVVVDQNGFEAATPVGGLLVRNFPTFQYQDPSIETGGTGPEFLMRATDLNTGNFTTWRVTGTPDETGERHPYLPAEDLSNIGEI